MRAREIWGVVSKLCWFIVVGWGLIGNAGAQARGANDRPLQLRFLTPGPIRSTLTNSWGTLQTGIINPNDSARVARLVVYYAVRPDMQFGRDIWVPPHAAISTWLPIGPAPRQFGTVGQCQLECLLYDQRGGRQKVELPTAGEGRVRARPVLVRPQELTTCVLLDNQAMSGTDDLASAPAIRIARAFRQAAGRSELLSPMVSGSLLPAPEALASINHVILAGHNLAHDPAGRQTLRRWLLQGGTVWIMLDKADPGVVADLLGDGVGPQIVDRTSLTTVEIRNRQGKVMGRRELEQPVDFVRVLPATGDRVLHTVNGWPASFSRRVGRGTVLCTALGARGWYRPRQATDGRSPFQDFPDLPVALPALEELANQLVPLGKDQVFTVRSFEPLLKADIGYSIVGPGIVAGVFGGFLAVVLLAGLWLRRSQRTDLIGWLGPAAAVLAGGAFFAMGERTRREVPPTVATVALVDVTTNSQNQPINGLLAVYHPREGAATITADQGGMLDFDMAGLEGKKRDWITSDVGAWHIEGLSLPAGVRLGSFHTTLHLTKPPTVAAQLASKNTVEGQLTISPFDDLHDAVLTTPSGQPLAVQLGADGRFTANATSLLPGQYLAGAVLTDQQQRREAVYRDLLGDAMPLHLVGRAALLAWADTAKVPFKFDTGARTVGSTLFVVPITLTRPAPGQSVTIPSAFLRCQRVLAGQAASRPKWDATAAVDQHLRFQLPPELLPFKIEKVKLSVSARAVARRLSVAALVQDRSVPLKEVTEPNGAIEVSITQPELLHLDAEGGLHLRLAISELLHPLPMVNGAANKNERWTLSDLQLEITGQAPR